jgi:hypothetical protein
MDIEAPIEAHSRYVERGTRNECDTPSDKIYKREAGVREEGRKEAWISGGENCGDARDVLYRNKGGNMMSPSRGIVGR